MTRPNARKATVGGLLSGLIVASVILGQPRQEPALAARSGLRAVGVREALPSPPARLLPGQHAYTSGVLLRAANHRPRFVRVNYLLYAPAAIRSTRVRTWPLLVFLHGYGERGSDPWLLTAQPLPKTLARTSSFQAIVLSPQLPSQFNDWSPMIEPIDKLVQRLAARYPVDRHRLYLTGLSTGGYGTWIYASRHPSRFAALVPIAGGYPGGVPVNICALRTTPIWAFHGGADTIISPNNSEVLVQALRRCGSKVVRFTLYPGVDHFHSWTRAYADPDLWHWLFVQHRH